MVAEGGREVGKAIEMEENKLTSSWIFHICVSAKKKIIKQKKPQKNN